MAVLESKVKIQASHGLNMIYSFLTLFVINALALAIANAVFPTNIVLGTYSVPRQWAIFHVTFILTTITVFVMPIVTTYEWKNKMTFTPMHWLGTYFIVNLLILWIITRFAENLGFGVSSFIALTLVVAFFDFVQGMAMMALGKFLK